MNLLLNFQSLTTPEFSLNRSNASDNVFEDSQDVESQNNNNGVGRNSLRLGAFFVNFFLVGSRSWPKKVSSIFQPFL